MRTLLGRQSDDSKAGMRFREWNYVEADFTYGQRIAIGQIFTDESRSEYQRMADAWKELYGWPCRLMPPKMRHKRLNRMLEGLQKLIDLEQMMLDYKPTAEEERAGIKDYAKRVGDMGTLKALAKAYAQDPDKVLEWKYGKVFGILQTDLEEYKYQTRLQRVMSHRKGYAG